MHPLCLHGKYWGLHTVQNKETGRIQHTKSFFSNLTIMITSHHIVLSYSTSITGSVSLLLNHLCYPFKKTINRPLVRCSHIALRIRCWKKKVFLLAHIVYWIIFAERTRPQVPVEESLVVARNVEWLWAVPSAHSMENAIQMAPKPVLSSSLCSGLKILLASSS